MSDNKKTTLKLRPHHVTEFMKAELNPSVYNLTDEEYLTYVRKNFPPTTHDDQTLILYRNTLKGLHDDPAKQFKYVSGRDSICERCKGDPHCNEPGEHHDFVKKVDAEHINTISELKFGETYSGNDLRQILIKRGLLKQ